MNTYEVNQIQFAIAKAYLSGVVARRNDGKNYYIKVMMPGKTDYVKNLLKL